VRRRRYGATQQARLGNGSPSREPEGATLAMPLCCRSRGRADPGDAGRSQVSRIRSLAILLRARLELRPPCFDARPCHPGLDFPILVHKWDTAVYWLYEKQGLICHFDRYLAPKFDR
jgi:hypothetical protein